ncbi:hypothetical protein VMT65_09335 [Nocardia sp. CDC153]|uniref:hypothetical protein n=1 Tax=Nocardia sp. CDC153 TaxID=3112167 RepID=UPI002DB7B19A|nr:hypothetical protein [Nocardia sp. CDC153]MEC3953229.1 hypothetical protein [Nocardia sp. CDC153]
MAKIMALVGVLAAVTALGTASLGTAAANPVAVDFDQCGEAQYVTDLFTALDRGDFQGDHVAASARAQAFAAAAPAEIQGDAILEANAITAVLGGAPSEPTLRTDPVWQAWGDVMDWHTEHCL